ncbi:MAG TPA: acyltransferase, partial [Polyangiales bacterium]|nr:acyltransferase [Polyangiales bacterium]
MQKYVVSPERHSQSSTVCSYADWQSRHGTVSIAFCYPQRLDHDRLRESLARVLSDYQDYAGRIRMVGSTMHIDHGDQGVLFEVATSTESYDDLRARAERGEDRVVCPPMSRRRTLHGREPLLMIRVTETSDGCILGVTWHHSVGELASTLQLMMAWSKAYSHEAYEVPPLVLDRAQYLDEHMPDPASAVSAMRLVTGGELFALVPFVLQKRQRVDFDFGWDQLEQLQDWAKRDAYVGPYDALCAHASGVLRRLAPERPVEQLALAVNYRKRVGLPANIIGNLISTVTVDLAPKDDDSSDVAHALREKLSNYASAHADYHATRR